MKTKVYATYTLNATNGANINGRPSSGNSTKNVFVDLKLDICGRIRVYIKVFCKSGYNGC